MLNPGNKSLFLLVLIISVLFIAAKIDLSSLAKETQDQLIGMYDSGQEAVKLKKTDLLITPDGFFRYRKTLISGKQEYFSFNISRFKHLDFLGTEQQGSLIVTTSSDDIIVQTYNDPKGNIDSMTSIVQLPVKSVQPETLATLQRNFEQIKKELGK